MGFQQAKHQVDGRGLSGSVGTQQAEYFPLSDVKGQIVHSRQSAKTTSNTIYRYCHLVFHNLLLINKCPAHKYGYNLLHNFI